MTQAKGINTIALLITISLGGVEYTHRVVLDASYITFIYNQANSVVTNVVCYQRLTLPGKSL